MPDKWGLRIPCALASAVLLASCNALPRAGADHRLIEKGAVLELTSTREHPEVGYALVDLTEHVLSVFPEKERPSLSKGFGATRKGPPDLPIGVGDILEITLFESAAGGLFIPSEAGSRPGNFITLPRQTVDTDGTVTVPYAGRIVAAGRSPSAVQSDIVARLADRAIEPQAVINLISSRSSELSVLGDVNAPAKISVNPVGERVLDAIARAGGISTPNAETQITLQRNGTSATVPFELLLNNPTENIFVYPGDVIFASRDRRTYLAFGASGLNGRIDFEDSDLTLAEAVGKAGGLLDSRADPGQVFVYRKISASKLSEMGIAFDAKSEGEYPVIFRINYRDPSAYFLAQDFPMEDKDIIYVSNADSVEVLKFLTLVNSVTAGTAGPFTDAAAVKTSVKILRN